MENWQTPGMTRFINKKKGCEKMTYIFSQPSFLMGGTRLAGVGVQRVQKVQRVQRVVVGAFLEIWGSQYDKIDLVGWWAGRYSRRGLPLRGRGAYGPVLRKH